MKQLPLSLQMILVLFTITSLSGLILTFMWESSKEKIAINEKKDLERAIFSVNPTVKSYEEIKIMNRTVYLCFDSEKQLVNRFVIGQQNGFQAPIKLGIAVHPDFKKLDGIRVLEQTETPGLGDRIRETGFLSFFEQLKLRKTYPFLDCIKGESNKDNSEISAITGATISSQAVVNIINDTLADIQKEEE